MSNIALKFRAQADTLQKSIDAKRDPAIRQQNLTPRRARIAQGMAKDADRLEQIQTLLRALASAHENEALWCVFEEPAKAAGISYLDLKKIRSKADIERLPYGVLGQLLGPTVERPEQKLRRMEEELLGTKIPGFFPTPAETVDKLVRLAKLYPGANVLEPSAGKGDIADGIVRAVGAAVNLLCVEPVTRLADICRAKGHSTICGDIFADIFSGPVRQFDRIIMNPPFEKGQDMQHVTYCFNHLLRPGGILVAIVSEAPFFREGIKFMDFRDFLNQHQTQEPIKLESAFEGAQSFRQTGVTTRIVVLAKDLAWQQTSSRNSSKTSEMPIPA
jgi:predicted RNA methylase